MGREMTLRAAVVLALLGCLGGCSCNDPAPVSDAGERRDGTPADTRVDAPGDLWVDAVVADVGGDVADLAVDGPGDVGVDVAVADLGGDVSLVDLAGVDRGGGDAGPDAGGVTTAWALRWGGTKDDLAVDMGIDGAGNVYVLAAKDYVYGHTFHRYNAREVYVMKYSPAGKLLWQQRITRPNAPYLWAEGLAVDAAGNSYAVVAAGTVTNDDTTIHKLSPAGKPVWTVALDKWGRMDQKSIVVDTLGDVYITGGVAEYFGSIKLDFNKGTTFVAKLSAQGKWVWAKEAGGPKGGPLTEAGIALDGAGNVVVGGRLTFVPAEFDQHKLTNIYGAHDVWVAKLNKTGTQWQWAVSAGGQGQDQGWGITADGAGNVYFTGYVRGTAHFGSLQVTATGMTEVFVTKLSSAGSFSWVVLGKSAQHSYGNGVGVDARGTVFATGYVSPGSTFGGVAASPSNGGAFVAEITGSGTVRSVTAGAEADGIDIGLHGRSAYVAGYL